MFSSMLSPSFNLMEKNLFIALSQAREFLFFRMITKLSNCSLLDWREVVILIVQLCVVVTVGLIFWLYHWKKSYGEISSEVASEHYLANEACNYKPDKSLCGLCFEEIDTCRMFENETCSHSFCYHCTTKHIATKVQANMKDIPCLEVNCKSLLVLDCNFCRKILPKSVYREWLELTFVRYEPSISICGICFEEVETWKMFKNNICSHSFCCNCTTKYIAAKIQVNSKDIFCPEVNCKTMLDYNSCRNILPETIVIKWAELLCMSLIPVSQRTYCPFKDCLSMLVNDSGRILRQVQCPACRRLFCAKCSVPWHPEFSCEEFCRLNMNIDKRGDEFVNELAKKKSWRRCPNCKIFVEKTAGCLHITCRCKFEFCYRCGVKWHLHKGACKPGTLLRD